jgi:hypothetical protein
VSRSRAVTEARGRVQEPRGNGTSAVGSRYRKTGENTSTYRSELWTVDL